MPNATVRRALRALLREHQQRHGFARRFVPHDLGVVEDIGDRVVVIQAGRSAEVDEREAVFDRPRHDQARGLPAAAPRLARHSRPSVSRMWTEFDRPGLAIGDPKRSRASARLGSSERP